MTRLRDLATPTNNILTLSLLGIALAAGPRPCVADTPDVAIVAVASHDGTAVSPLLLVQHVDIKEPSTTDEDNDIDTRLHSLASDGTPIPLSPWTTITVTSPQLVLRLMASTGATFDLSADYGTVAITPEYPGAHIRLERGSLSTRGTNAVVSAGDITLGSKSTRFQVRAHAQDDQLAVQCIVYDGTVTLTSEGPTSIDIGSLRKWSTSQADAPLVPVEESEVLDMVRSFYAVDRVQLVQRGVDVPPLDTLMNHYVAAFPDPVSTLLDPVARLAQSRWALSQNLFLDALYHAEEARDYWRREPDIALEASANLYRAAALHALGATDIAKDISGEAIERLTPPDYDSLPPEVTEDAILQSYLIELQPSVFESTNTTTNPMITLPFPEYIFPPTTPGESGSYPQPNPRTPTPDPQPSRDFAIPPGF